MLFEFRHVRQETGYFRRWFDDEYFDLIIWYEDDGTITGFQLCYDKAGYERALTWTKDFGFRHEGVDDGEEARSGGVKMSPVLVPDGDLPFKVVIREFENRGGSLEPEVRKLVLDKLSEFRDITVKENR